MSIRSVLFTFKLATLNVHTVCAFYFQTSTTKCPVYAQQIRLVRGIAVLFICGKIIVVIFVHHGVGPSLLRGRSCAGALSNTQQPASARLSQ
jgi:hypothetical protein